jgi:NTP pyrophosphatase (non-canonical NTP hydrolase)
MALIAEAAEIVEHFQWMTEADSRTPTASKRLELEMEIADVALYLIRLSDILGIDLYKAARKKLRINAKKYPARRVRGSAKKYSEY